MDLKLVRVYAPLKKVDYLDKNHLALFTIKNRPD
jgi:hypothetical protein